MITYLIRNEHINQENIIPKILDLYKLEIVDKSNSNTVIGNSDMLIDFDNYYTNVLLFNEKLNIRELKNLLLNRESN